MLVVLRPEGADWLNPGIATFVSIGWSQPLPLEDGIILTGAPTPTVRLVVLPQVVVGAEYLVGWHFTRISQLHSTCFYDGIAGRTTVGGSVRRPTKSTTSSAWPQPVAATSQLPRHRGAGPCAFPQPAREQIRDRQWETGRPDR